MNVPDTREQGRHDEIWLLLPWYVNGTLDPMEYTRVRTHLRTCPCCRDEVAAQANLRTRIHAAAPLEAAVAPPFEKLMARIRDEEHRRVPAAVECGSGSALAGLLRWLSPPQPHPLIWAAAAVLCAAVLLPRLPALRPVAEGQVFHTAANPGSLEQFDPNDIRVVFARPLSAAAVEAIVAPLHGRIVGEPAGPGVFTIRFDGQDPSPEGVAVRLERLRGHKDVALAEPALPVSAAPPP